jgi:hypothetical protein
MVLAGCDQLPGTEVLQTVEPGTPKADVLALFPHGGIIPSDPMDESQILQGYWFERYFVAGGTVEVVWIYDVEAGYPEEDFRSSLNPVIFREELLDGWGWEHFDLRREEWMLMERRPMPASQGLLVDPMPSVPPLPGAPEAIPADSAPILPRGDGAGQGIAA